MHCFKTIREKRKHTVFAAILSVVTVLLAVALVCALYVISKLEKNNLFTKSILVDNNYFMSGYTYDENGSGIKSQEDMISEAMEIIQKTLEDTVTDVVFYTDEGMESAEISEEIAIPDGDNAEEIEIYSKETDHRIIYIDNLLYRARMIYSAYGYNSEANELVQETISDMLGYPIEFEFEDSAFVEVPYISQEGILPNGCEAVSATMLLRFYGFDISPENFVDDYLECEPVTIKWGTRYGPNPKKAYAGDPRSEDAGYGCFAPVILKALSKYLPDGYYAKNVTGMSLAALAAAYIDNGIPVAVWGTIGMEEIDKMIQWQSNDKTESFLYPANEHCMVFTGYDSEKYYFSDPYESNGTVGFPIDDAVMAYNMLGAQAIVILKDGN